MSDSMQCETASYDAATDTTAVHTSGSSLDSPFSLAFLLPFDPSSLRQIVVFLRLTLFFSYQIISFICIGISSYAMWIVVR